MLHSASLQSLSNIIILYNYLKHTSKNVCIVRDKVFVKYILYILVDFENRFDVPRPPLKMQIPPSLPSWILFLRSVGLLSVLIHTPAMALSKISLSSMKPKPEGHRSRPVIDCWFTFSMWQLKISVIWRDDIQRVSHPSCKPKCLRFDLPRSCSV